MMKPRQGRIQKGGVKTINRHFMLLLCIEGSGSAVELSYNEPFFTGILWVWCFLPASGLLFRAGLYQLINPTPPENSSE